jgi:hypothetical protein
MDEQFQEDWLERSLREEMPYIDDAGFTARVVQKLPAAPAPRSYRAAILASIIAYFLSDGGRFFVVEAYRLVSMPIGIIALVAICCTLVMTAVAAGAAWSNMREQR